MLRGKQSLRTIIENGMAAVSLSDRVCQVTPRAMVFFRKSYHELLGFDNLAQQEDEKKACARMLARLTANIAKATGDWGLIVRSWEGAL
jgi:hypothetical protein